MDVAERALLASTVGDAIAAAVDRGAALDPVLTELGWPEMLEAEPADAVAIVFRALGRANGTATALDDVIVAALGNDPRADLGVLLPPFAAWDPPGTTDGGRVTAAGIATERVTRASEVLVVCRTDDGVDVVTVPVSALDATPVQGVDPSAGFHLVPIDSQGAGVPLDPAAWETAISHGRIAVAQQLAGASRAMLELACTHAVERVQFGTPIARFQAVRHRLAEALVAVEAIEAVLSAARDDPGTTTAALAKATAGRTARTVGAHCQQVLAGIGFTTDHPFHRFLKRTIALEGIFGSADEIATDLGRELLATRLVPTLIEL